LILARWRNALPRRCPANAIVCDESNTAGLFCYDAAPRPATRLADADRRLDRHRPAARHRRRHRLPRPARIALEADGSALYTIQALWTQAREALNVTNVILNNGAYAILRLEMMRAGVNASEAANALFDLTPARDRFLRASPKASAFPRSAWQTPAADLTAALDAQLRRPGPSSHRGDAPMTDLPTALCAQLLNIARPRFSRAAAVRDHHGGGGMHFPPLPPQAVASVENLEEIVAIVRACAAHGTPIIPLWRRHIARVPRRRAARRRLDRRLRHEARAPRFSARGSRLHG
jgi:hypothetical protein